jgi:adenylate kinase family enzyme
MQRICVIGVTGSGKTTLAGRLANQLGLPLIELDALFWDPDWTPVDPDVFRSRVAEAAASEAWVADGNYSRARDILWPRADTLVWLDLPFHVAFARLLRRTFVRRLRNVELWSGNRESLRTHLLSKDSLFLWAINTHPRYRREFPQLLREQAARGATVFRLRSARDVELWLAESLSPDNARRCARLT